MEFRTDVHLGMKRPLSIPLMNGGGCCKTVEHVKILAESPLQGAIVAGSFTYEERSGNPGDVFWTDDNYALNSLGMPNGGRAYLSDNIREMVTIAHDAEKAFIVNVAGFNPEEYAILTEIALNGGADAAELNLGCPNVVKNDGARKPIASFDLEAAEDILLRVEQRAGKSAPVLVKVSPYSDPGQLKRTSVVLLRYPVVKAVVAVNTVPNAYGLRENGKPLIGVGLAGMSGPALKPFALGQVFQWHEALGGKIDIVGAGGIRSGRDVRDYELAGASGFQITTELLKGGDLNPRVFERVVTEYFSIV
jgi:dihydroorotate dehydrogenase (fumarate)